MRKLQMIKEIHDFINSPHLCRRKNYQFKAEVHISQDVNPLVTIPKA